jgi:acetolactate synthase-1/2/3 large subunit
MTGGELLIECLKAQGVRAIFGMPGTQNLQIYDALERFGSGVIDHYLVRHEYAATVMADGFARSTGEVGVALTVPGPGASNASTGILEAYTDCVPVLLITGQSDTAYSGRDPAKMFHGLDQMRFFAPITKFCATASTAAEIPTIVEAAFRAMRSGRPGPAVLEFPQDVITAASDTGGDIPVFAAPDVVASPDPTAVEAAAAALDKAETPILFAGHAVIAAGAVAELRQLAEQLAAPVMVTRRGKGAIDEVHPLALRDVRGYLARQAVEVADCTLAVGCRFTSIDTASWSREFPRPLIQLDPEPSEIGREYECDVGVTGDLKESLSSLTRLVTRRDSSSSWTAVLRDLRRPFEAQPPLPLLPEIRTCLPPEGILAVDVHGIGYSTFAEYPVADPMTFLYPCIGVSLGYAFPAALGAKVAHPDRPVICFSGDGGFLMGSPELATAMRYGINVVTVVVNDGALSAIKGAQIKQCEGRTIDTELHNPDFVEFARSFGAYAERVEDVATQFEPALKRALEASRPVVLEVSLTARQEELMSWVSWLREDLLRRPGEVSA